METTTNLRKNWIAVASAEHARRGRDAKEVRNQQHPVVKLDCGFMQVCHGKLGPIKRVQPGDRVAYYAPATTMGGKDKLQSLVSIGLVQAGDPYAFDMGSGFVPYRRDIAYVQAKEVPILPLLEELEFVEDRQRWGYKFRFGLFSISDHDMRLIADAMNASAKALYF